MAHALFLEYIAFLDGIVKILISIMYLLPMLHDRLYSAQ